MVTYIATATPGDEEMEVRIQQHRDARPDAWRTVESPRNAGGAVRSAKTAVVVLDCLTLLASNALLSATKGLDPSEEEEAARAVTAEVDAILEAAEGRDGILLVVTNEVGLGLVPPTRLGRWYQDALGRANRRLAEVADEVVFMVSGFPLLIRGFAPHPSLAPGAPENPWP